MGREIQKIRRQSLLRTMKVLPIKKNEPLYKWRERLAKHYNLSEDMQAILEEVSIVSYIHGADLGFKAGKKV